MNAVFIRAEGAYYTRTCATNSAGTTYGNCISFKVSGATGLEEMSVSDTDLKIYPIQLQALPP